MSRSPRFSNRPRLVSKQPPKNWNDSTDTDPKKLKQFIKQLENERNEYIKVNQHLAGNIELICQENESLKNAITDRKVNYERLLDQYSQSFNILDEAKKHNKKMSKKYHSYKTRVRNLQQLTANQIDSNQEMIKFQQEIDDIQKSAILLMQHYPESEEKVYQYQILLLLASSLMNINDLFSKEANNCLNMNNSNFEPPNRTEIQELDKKIKDRDEVKNELPLVDNDADQLTAPQDSIERLTKKLRRCIPIYNQIQLINERKSFTDLYNVSNTTIGNSSSINSPKSNNFNGSNKNNFNDSISNSPKGSNKNNFNGSIPKGSNKNNFNGSIPNGPKGSNKNNFNDSTSNNPVRSKNNFDGSTPDSSKGNNNDNFNGSTLNDSFNDNTIINFSFNNNSSFNDNGCIRKRNKFNYLRVNTNFNNEPINDTENDDTETSFLISLPSLFSPLTSPKSAKKEGQKEVIFNSFESQLSISIEEEIEELRRIVENDNFNYLNDPRSDDMKKSLQELFNLFLKQKPSSEKVDHDRSKSSNHDVLVEVEEEEEEVDSSSEKISKSEKFLLHIKSENSNKENGYDDKNEHKSENDNKDKEIATGDDLNKQKGTEIAKSSLKSFDSFKSVNSEKENGLNDPAKGGSVKSLKLNSENASSSEKLDNSEKEKGNNSSSKPPNSKTDSERSRRKEETSNQPLTVEYLKSLLPNQDKKNESDHKSQHNGSDSENQHNESDHKSQHNNRNDKNHEQNGKNESDHKNLHKGGNESDSEKQQTNGTGGSDRSQHKKKNESDQKVVIITNIDDNNKLKTPKREKPNLVNVKTNTGYTMDMVKERINEQRLRIEAARSKVSKYDPSIFRTNNLSPVGHKRSRKINHVIKLTVTLKDIGLEGLDSWSPDEEK